MKPRKNDEEIAFYSQRINIAIVAYRLELISRTGSLSHSLIRYLSARQGGKH